MTTRYALKSGENPTEQKASVRQTTARDYSTLWLLLILGVGLLSYLPWLGSFGPTDPTDSFFLESGREMVETGKYLLPLNNYEPWLDKPVLYFWMVAGAYKLFGVSPFVGRLPAALSAVALGGVIFHSTVGLLRRRTAALAAIIFLCLPLSSVVGHVCLTDMTLTLLVSGTILYLFRGLRERSRKSIFIGYLFNALGLLCKGPIASVLSAAALALYLVVSRRSVKGVWQGVRELNPFAGLLIASVVNLPWYVAAMSATNGKFFEAFFLQQNFGRMMGTVNHQMPWWFYIPVFFGGFFPWCLLTASVPKLFKRSVEHKTNETNKNTHVEIFRLALCWFCVVILLFSAIKTKLPTYILPAAPAFALLIALQVEVLARRSLRHLFAISAVSLVAVTIAACIQPLLPIYMRTIVSDNLVAGFFIVASVVLSLALLSKGRARAAVVSLAVATTIACAVFVPHGLRSFHNYRQVGFNSLVVIARDAKATVGILSAEEPMMPYILHQPVYRLQSQEDADKFIKTGQAAHYLLAPAEMIKRLDWFPGGSHLIANNGKWYLYEVFAL